MKPRCLDCFQSLSVKHRFEIYNLIKDGGHRVVVSDLVKAIKLSQPTVTFHLNVLEKAGLISKTKSGREVICRVSSKCSHCAVGG